MYPYPAALFKRTGLNRRLRNHMHKIIGNAIFNEYVLDKRETYDWLSAFIDIKPHIPETKVYNHVGDLRKYLNLFSRVYIKPIVGSQGVGIVEISKENEGFLVSFVEDNYIKKIKFQNESALCKYLDGLLTKGKVIIQRGVELVHTEGRKNDFRLLILKNNKGIWEDYGMIVRHGVKGSIISNISGGGVAEKGDSFLRNSLNLNEDNAYQLRKQISNLAIKVGEAIDLCGVNCGNLGIDMGIDDKGHIWIIEVNNKDPNHTIALDANEKNMFYSIKKANMLYAKRLAGF